MEMKTGLAVAAAIFVFNTAVLKGAVSGQVQNGSKFPKEGLWSVDVMKYTKDVMAHQMSDEEIDQLVSVLKTMNVNCIALSLPMDASEDYPASNRPAPRDAYAATQKWAGAIHRQGLRILWRGAWSGMEGISGFPKLVGPARFPAGTAASAATDGNSTWLSKTYQYIVNHPGFFANGDIWAPMPERTENIFQDSSSFLPDPGDGTNAAYTRFFNDLKTISDAAFAKIDRAVVTGMSTNNYTEVESGWLPQSFFEAPGLVVIDYYGDKHTPEEMDWDLRHMYALRHKAIFLQEWSDYWNGGMSEADRIAYLNRIYSVMQKLVDDGVLVGFNYWGGWSDKAESVLTHDSSGFHVNDHGRLLQKFFKATQSSRSQ